MIVIVIGTRPEIIKTAPIIWELEKRKEDYTLINTGQHYDDNMNGVFFRGLEIEPADYDLNIGSSSHAHQTAAMMIELETKLKNINPDVVLVQGDTNTVFAGAIVASKLHIPIAHVEAGLRSFDRKMPEEINRAVTDHLSTFLFPPTRIAHRNLKDEGLSGYITGNTIVDVVQRYSSDLRKPKYKNYLLVTLHRAELTDDINQLRGVLGALHDLSKQHTIIFPIHPRTLSRLRKFRIDEDGIRFIHPQGYLDFLSLLKHTNLVITDSGGIQEEACILGTPCVTYRKNTERPETIEAGANTLVYSPNELINTVNLTKNQVSWANPFGDGNSGEQIVDYILKYLFLKGGN